MTIDTTGKKSGEMASQEARWRPINPSKQDTAKHTDGSSGGIVSDTEGNAEQEAMDDWQRTLDGFEGASFPSQSPSAGQPMVVESFAHRFPHTEYRQDTTSSSLIRAAWALIAGQLTHCGDVMFGTDVFRCSLLDGDSTRSLSNVATIPIRIRFRPRDRVVDYLNGVQQQEMTLMSFRDDELQHIAQIWPESRQAALFQTLVVKQNQRPDGADGLKALGEFSLVLEYHSDEYGITIRANYNSRAIKKWMVKKLLQRLEHAVSQLVCADSSKTIEDIEMTTERELEEIWAWNKTVPQRVERCLHDMIEELARSQPNEPALCAWDGELTYSELNRLSTILADGLAHKGVRPGVLVPLFFEKSMWTTVAVLGVLKAGGGFVLLDPSLPEKRLEETTEQLEATVALSSPSSKAVSSKLASHVIVIDSEYFSGSNTAMREAKHEVKPSSTAYVIFTSGSTGTPKGVIISHENVASVIPQHGKQLGYTRNSRIYDFSSYSFGAAQHNMFSALLAGGCLCVPSDHDRRSNLQQSIVALRANSLALTPSLLDSISPQQVPGLKTIILGGEAVHMKNVERWWGHLKLITVYGSSECTTVSTINNNAATHEEITGIGRGCGLVSWVVDPNNHNVILAPGCIGELLLEGPAVGQGYLKDPQKTAGAFISDPEWLVKGTSAYPGRHGRLYKTGDLVQYNEDGNLTFVGRKDAQVKLRGQRIELGEVEYRVQLCVPKAKQVVAEIFTPLGDSSSPELGVFLQMDEYEDGSSLATIIPMASETTSKLAEYLPSYMIPTVFFSMKELPMTPTGKMNRKVLREIGGGFSVQQLAELRTARQGPKRPPSSDIEVQMQQIWAKVLKLDSHTIGLDDSFYQLGGDSIAAMRVVGDARRLGLNLAVADIIHHPKLYQISKRTTIRRGQVSEEIQPFSLLGGNLDTSSVIKDIARLCQQNLSGVQDAYPCTPLQEGLLSLSLQRKGDYVMQDVLEMSSHIDLQRFRESWEEVVRKTPILRTRIVNHNTLGLIQVVLNEKIRWAKPESLTEYLKSDRDTQMDLGCPLTRYAIVEEDVGSKRWFIWTIHHALYDGWSASLIKDAVNEAYQGKLIKQQSGFQNFVKLIKTQDEKKAQDYWIEALAGCQSAQFPELPPHIGLPLVDEMLKIQIPQPQHRLQSFTTSTIIRAAWALVMSSTTNSSDAVFGATVFGRNDAVSGIESMVGPTIATVPLRIKLDQEQAVSQYMEMVHKQVAEMIPFEHTGLHHIRKMSPSAQQACSFQTLLVVQPQETVDIQSRSVIGEWQDSDERQWLDTYALVLVVQPQTDTVDVTASFDSRVISPWMVQMLLQRLKSAIQQLSTADRNAKISFIDVVTDCELDQIWEWNRGVHEPSKRCIHEMFEEKAIAQPDAPAIHAWDGELTYRKLNELSSSLAHQLVKLGIKSETLIPLCFEKSMWTSVAMLGVLKAGGAFVLLDSWLPEQRLGSITRQLQAKFILSSRLNYSLSSSLASHAIAIDDDFFKGLNEEALLPLPTTSPESTMHLVFTSGSTGTPKGALVSHRNMASTLHHQMKALQITSKSRVFDFASYAFDVAVYNASAAFTTGGCLCVPSEQDRRDRPSESISSLGATVAMITPTVARCLSPEKVPSLQSILFCGEALRVSDVLPWWGKIKVYNTYGPAECTATSVMNPSARSPEEVTLIGKGAGQLTWIVDPQNHNRLTPVGSTGELLLEGPLVGQGYLNDVDKTASAFIESPAWMLRRGRRGRLYKTGDLVRYTKDGSLVYMGRKDTQVKIRGQRVELGEVEHWVRHYMPEASRVAVEVITPQGTNAQPILASFLQLEDVGKSNVSEPEVAQVLTVPADLDDKLSQHLPSYMVPTAFLGMRELPIGTTGKMDRKRLREIGASFSNVKISGTHKTDKGKRQPTSEIEDKLQKIWGRLLNINAAMIGIDDSFFKLGGDSISAMQVASAARSESIDIRVVDILREKTIASLATSIDPTKTNSGQSASGHASHLLLGSMPPQLGPIQRLYFNLQSDPRKCFDQCFFFELRKRISYESLFAAIKTIVSRHEALRTCFSYNDQKLWEPCPTARATESFFMLHQKPTHSGATDAIRQCREHLDIENGPLLAGVLFDGGEKQKLFLAIHHLAIDLMSWRIILNEIESLLIQGTIVEPIPTSFASWTAMQTQFAREKLEEETPSSLDQKDHLAFWGMNSSLNLRGGSITNEFILDESISAAILNNCNDALGTRPHELMISALICSFAAVFPDHACPQIFTEGHGRESWDDNIDISTTVGWFTTMFPIQISSGQGTSLRETIRQTKDYLRGLSRNGWTYFTSKFADKDRAESLAKQFPVEILFNYAGSYQQLERDEGLFEETTVPSGCSPASSLEVRRFSLFEVDMRVVRGRISASIHFHKDMHHQDKIAQWVSEYEATMKQMTKDFSNASTEWTISDFPLAFTSYDQIADVQNNRLAQLGILAEDVDDIFPCSPMQEGVLLAQSKDPSTYYQWVDFEMHTDGADVPIDETKLRQAWRAVVKRHSLLRAILVDRFPGSSRTMHVVLKDPEPPITWDSTTGHPTIEQIQNRNSSTMGSYFLQHHFKIREIKDHVARLRIEMNHTIVDGFSYSILWHDLQKAYHYDLSPGGLYSDFISHLEGETYDANREFWAQHLAAIEPCFFPPSSKGDKDSASFTVINVPNLNTRDIREFCANWDVTPATLIQTAWALVLRTYTGSTTPCFGNLCSGRDVPVHRASEIFGPLIGMVPYRIHLGESVSVIDALRRVQKDYLNSLPHQHFPLSEIHRVVGLKDMSLFNTIVSFQKVSEEYGSNRPGPAIDLKEYHDPTEYDITISVKDARDEISIELNLRPGFSTSTDSQQLVQRINTAICKIIQNPEKGVNELSFLTEADSRKVWEWNKTVPRSATQSVNEMILAQTKLRPRAPAVCAWDGNLTYEELHQYSSKLACQLVQLGVKPNEVVPLCFEKSMWITVAILGVMKAGGGFLLLDSTAPKQRLTTIVQSVKPRFIVSSSFNEAMSLELCEKIILFSPDQLSQLPDEMDEIDDIDFPSLDTTLYMIFTSGSTGIPKGATVSHRNVASAVYHQSKALDLNHESRVFDFSSHSFDVPMLNTFMALTAGSCLCIPSEDDRRSKLAASMAQFRTTFAFLTPSVARLVSPEQIPTLRAIGLCGEAVQTKDVTPWWGRVKVLNIYGPSECTPISAINYCPRSPEEAVDIGKGLGVVTWIVDPDNHNSLVAPGSVGELLLEGPIIGQGYLNDLERTDAAYIRDPSWLLEGYPGYPGRQGRLYKTGDLVQYNDDGSLAFVARKDTQLKIRGQRVELEEIEHRVQQCIPSASQVIVEAIIPQGDSSTQLLAAFLQLKGDTNDSNKANSTGPESYCISVEVEAELTKYLPLYMIPTVFFSMTELPWTSTGKTDRRRLRQIGGSFSAQDIAEMSTLGKGPKRQPTRLVEEQMRQIWANVLDIQPNSIGMDDSFFRLGGDSIAAMKVVGEAHKLGINLTVADIFRRTSISAMLHEHLDQNGGKTVDIPRTDITGSVNQSFAQGRLWFMERLHPGLTWYLMPIALQLVGPLQLDALNKALLALQTRHETLRTVFSSENGVSMQRILPFEPKELNVIDVSKSVDTLSQMLEKEQTTPFNLETDPGWRTALYREDENTYTLSIVMHHIISDGWSVDILRKELAIFYSAAIRNEDPLSQVKPLSIRYQDYSIWEKKEQQAIKYQEQLDYWVNQLDTSRPAEIFCDKLRPSTLSGMAGMQDFMIEGPLYKKLLDFCATRNVTPFNVLLATFRATHFRLTGQADATIGRPNANRDRWEVHGMIGFFVNLQCISIKIEDESFEELIQQVNSTTTDAFANQDVPFENVVAKLEKTRDLSRHPVVQTTFAFHSQMNIGDFHFEGLQSRLRDLPLKSRFDLEFHVFQETDSLRAEMLYSKDLYNPETIRNTLSVFTKILERGLSDPSVAVASILLLDDEDRTKLENMGMLKVQQTGYPRDLSVVDVFRQKASQCGWRIAVKDSSEQLSYAELDMLSDVLASWLRKRSLPSETIVAVLASRSCQTIVAILGILKAGMAYLPLDEKTPQGRLENIFLSIKGPKIVLVNSNTEHPPLSIDVEFVSIEKALDNEKDHQSDIQTHLAGPTASSLAYVIFTSGSTGQPKGVMIEHRNILRLVREDSIVQHVPEGTAVGHVSSIAFDASAWEIYMCLLNGGTLICIDKMDFLEPGALEDILRREKVRLMLITPALLKQYLAECPSAIAQLDTLYLGGDRLDPHDVLKAQGIMKGTIINAYGPTENSIISTMYYISKDDQFENGVPIGRAPANSGAYVVDNKMNLVPLGVVGELVVVGDGLARGYTNLEQNINRFISMTIENEKVQAYRTGDYVRARPLDGQLEYLGRIDGQIKIRGQRIEVGEIEHIMRTHESVNDAVAILQQVDDHETQLVSFVTIHDAALQSKPDGGEESDDSKESIQVQVWSDFYNDEYSAIQSAGAKPVGRDFLGWTSMYDGSEIDNVEMNEWLDDAIRSIQNAGELTHVLEIGTGSGMILFNLPPGLESYTGLEPSEKAFGFVMATAKSIPTLADKVNMYQATATEIGRLDMPNNPDFVIINSVAQYFPSQEYLFKVVENLVKLKSVKTIYFGDIRSHALFREFLAKRALCMVKEKASKSTIRRMMSDMDESESEFLIDPAFFTSLRDRLPNDIEQVQILPKLMNANNELSCYRYAAIVHLKGRSSNEREIHKIEDCEWVDFMASNLDRSSLLGILQGSPKHTNLAICNIPHSKSLYERFVVDSLTTAEEEYASEFEWLSKARSNAKSCPSLSAVDLVGLASQTGWQVEISWKRQHSQRGGFDVIFHSLYTKNGKKNALFDFPDEPGHRSPQTLSSHPLRQQTKRKVHDELYELLHAQVPTYMVPQAITLLNEMPVNRSGKVDRAALAKKVQPRPVGTRSVQQPVTAESVQVQKIWATVLGVEPATIGLDDNFFQLGGNSISAMKVISQARTVGIQLAVADIFRYPTLRGVSNQVIHIVDNSVEEINPFALLSGVTDAEQLVHEVSAQLALDPTTIIDAYPCTPLQAGLVSLSSKQPGEYVVQGVMELSPDVSIERFQNAWDTIARHVPILHTRIVQQDDVGLLQVLLKEEIQWLHETSLERYLEQDRKQTMEVGQRLTRYAIVEDDESNLPFFVWTIHHALYDGWSLTLLLDEVWRQYLGQPLKPVPQFQSFIKYIQDQDNGKLREYWNKSLDDCACAIFPTLPPSISHPTADEQMQYQFSRSQQASQKFTTSTLIRAAWALVTSSMINSTDVVFGITVSGRSAPVVDVEKMLGPAISTVPLRVKFSGDEMVSEFLDTIQQQSVDMIPFEQMGLHRIAELSAGARQACMFQTLLVIQPQKAEKSKEALGKWQDAHRPKVVNTYALSLQIFLENDQVDVSALFDSRVIEPWVVKSMLKNLEFMMHQLDHAKLDTTLANLERISPRDLSRIWEWNRSVPKSNEQCIHEMIREQVKSQPNALAINAWDGNLSYQEMDSLADKLAMKLISLGVGPKVSVPLCFEKSLWAAVSVLAVLKAGGAFVLFDPVVPEQRLRNMVEQLGAHLILSSFSAKDLSHRLAERVLTVTEELFEGLDLMQWDLPKVDSSSAAYVLFTSGSTGTPKGVIVTHKNITSCVPLHANRLGYTNSSRIYDFASYSFGVALNNIFASLLTGACLCVPRDDERKSNLSASLASFRASSVMLTSSVAESLSSSHLPDLKSVVVGGEAVRLKHITPWWGKLKIIAGYGSSEITTIGTINDAASDLKEAINIGKAVGGATWVVDPKDHQRLLPPGCIGELVLEGPLVAVGYLNDPKKTSTVFLENPGWLTRGAPGHPGRHGRVYKTGDLVHYTEDGNLFYIGRKDAQVKIRGQRVELGEVEFHVQQYMPEATQVVIEVITPQGEDSSPLLAAFLQINQTTTDLVGHDGTKLLPIPADVEHKLAQNLPSYMRPTVFIAVNRLPTTSTEKINRKKLREIGGCFTLQQIAETLTSVEGPKQQPTTETERIIQGIWAKVLKIKPETINIDNSFVQLGGDSIAAMKVVGESRKLNLQLTVADLFRHPRLQDLARESDNTVKVVTRKVPRTSKTGPITQSSAQERLWFLDQLYPDLSWYLTPCAIRIHGPVQLDALNMALLALEERHETLRTTFNSEGESNFQVVQPFKPKPLRVIDIEGDEKDLMDALEKDRSTPFKLQTEPGWRVSIFRAGEDDHVLSIVMHHIISDGWSFDILRQELVKFYSAAIRGQDPLQQIDPLPIQYRDYSVWQKEQDNSEDHIKQLEYWVNQLKTSRPAEFLCDKPRPPTLSGCAKTERFQIKGPIYDTLQRFCKQQGVTLFTTLLAAFRATHFYFTGANDAAIGTVNANRDQWELKNIIGFFINMQCLRIKVEGESFKQLVRQVHDTTVASLEHQDIAFDTIVSKIHKSRDLSRHPLAQVTFAFHTQQDIAKFDFENTDTELMQFSVSSRFDIEFHLIQQENHLHGEIIYSTDLYNSETIKAILSVFQKVLEQGLKTPDLSLSVLPLLENDLMVDETGLLPCDKSEYPRDSSLIDVFRQQVSQNPERVAVRDTSDQLTYAQLDQQSELVAWWLSKRSLAAETLVGVFASRSCETIVAFFGIMKANLAYLPFDTNTPMVRMDKMLSAIEGQHRIVLVGSNVAPPPTQLDNVEFHQISDIRKQESQSKDAGSNLSRMFAPSPTSLAYAMFTSGSTGQPKGVMVEHRSIVRLVKNCNFINYLPRHATIANMASLAFDMSTWEIYTAILNGGTLICISPMTVLDPYDIAKVFVREKVDGIMITPVLLKQYLMNSPSIFSDLKAIYAGGDRVNQKDMCMARGLMQEGMIFNIYGPTENASISTFFPLVDDREYVNGVPIGGAISNTSLFVMDSHLNLVPRGVIGELVVTGDGLARGYMDSKQDKHLFVWIKFREHKIRAYRTGDYVRQRPEDGQLEYMGRIDGQVKVLGRRIELNEIDQALLTHTLVNEAATIVNDQGGSDPRIDCFVTIQDSTRQQKLSDTATKDRHDNTIRQQIWEKLQDQLPPYMIPKTITILDQIPFNNNGKVDRRALSELAETVSIEGQLEQLPKRKPETGDEIKMQAIWCKALRLEPEMIGLDDNFFKLGGDSMAAMKAVSMARQSNVQLAVADIFRFDTLEALAAKLKTRSGKSQLPEKTILIDPRLKAGLTEALETSMGIQRTEVADILPLTNTQEFHVTGDRFRQYCNYVFLDLGAGVDLARFETSVRLTVEKFPILRACFLPLMGRWWQIVLRKIDLIIQVEDVDGDLEEYSNKFCLANLQTLSPTDPPLGIFLLGRRSSGIRLIMRLSHSQYDGVSMPIILQSLINRYEGKEEVGSGPDFSTFLSYSSSLRAASIQYWRRVLKGSSPTSLASKLRPQLVFQNSMPKRIEAEAETPLPGNLGKATTATLVNAAWAILLSLITGESDVVYGHLVAGRNSDIPAIEKVVGSCINIIPVRVNLSSLKSPKELLQVVQDQFIAFEDADSLGFNDVIKECTDWPAGSGFQSIIQYQSIDERLEVELSRGVTRVDYYRNPIFMPSPLTLVAYPMADKIRFQILGNTHITTAETVKKLADGLCEVISKVFSNVNIPLSSCMENIDFTIQQPSLDR